MKWIQRFLRFIKEGEALIVEASEVLDSALELADAVANAGGTLSHKAQALQNDIHELKPKVKDYIS